MLSLDRKRGDNYFAGGARDVTIATTGLSKDLEMSIRRIVQDILHKHEDFFFKVPMASLTKPKHQQALKATANSIADNYAFLDRAPALAAASSKENALDNDGPVGNELGDYVANYQRGLGSGLKNLAAFVKVSESDLFDPGS